MTLIKIDGVNYQHITSLPEKRKTVSKRLERGKTSDTEAIDPKTKLKAVKLQQGWWVEVKD